MALSVVRLLRENPNFRRLWVADTVSLLGDWFNTLALFRLVSELTGSPMAIGLVLITKSLPMALISPLAGPVVDYVNRKRLMIWVDLLRAVVVLGFLLIDRPSRVPLLYALAAIQVMLSAFFIPAKSAVLPNIVPPNQLLMANAVMSATWSAMLAFGAALGGIAVEVLGVRATFILDSATYVVSAWWLRHLEIPERIRPKLRLKPLLQQTWFNVREGVRRIRQDPFVQRLSVAKAVWSFAGGGLVFLLTLLGEALTPDRVALGIGILYAARGLGTGIGPFVGRRVFRDETRWTLWLGPFVAFSGAMYFLAGLLPWTFWIAVLVVFAHASSGANWVFSTVMLQRSVEDDYRGRVFSAEMLMLTVADTFSVLLASALVQNGMLSLRDALMVWSSVMMLAGLVWGMIWRFRLISRPNWS